MGVVFVALLGTVLVAATWLTVLVRPATWPTSKSPTDQWAALSSIYGAGALLLAVMATVIATIAYINSTEKPRLFLRSSMALQFQDWSLSLEIQNRGIVTARFLAVRLKFIGARIALPYPGFPMHASWRTGPAGWDGASTAYWEGGADVVIHPNWDHLIPALRCNIQALGSDEPYVDIEIVADEVPRFLTRLALRDKPLEKPATITEEDLAIRLRGSPNVTEMMFTTFARPGVRQILDTNERRTPTRLDIVRPEKRSLRSTDLPATISGPHGVVVVTGIVSGGFILNEEQSAGEEIDVFVYF
jgi:hypothetical protein